MGDWTEWLDAEHVTPSFGTHTDSEGNTGTGLILSSPLNDSTVVVIGGPGQIRELLEAVMFQAGRTDAFIPIRRRALGVLLDEFPSPDVSRGELFEDPDRYALVEWYPGSGHHSISTHKTRADAAQYHVGQEDPWAVEFLEDLDTGKRWGSSITIDWVPR